MNYIAPRNMTVASICGRSVGFVKGAPTYCPPQMHAELTAAGVVPAEEIPEEPDTGEPKEPSGPIERQKAFVAAFERIVIRNNRDDFTAAGIPTNPALSKALGWPSVNSKERDAAWKLWTVERANT